MITEQWIREQISKGEEWRFYKTKQWLELKSNVMEKHHYECQECLKKGRYTRAKVVHHINELKQRPDLALNEYYIDGKGNKKRNLIPLCQECHNIAHNRICSNEYKKQLNEERW